MSLTRRQILLVKEESTYGTDAAPDATNNAILVSNPEIKEVVEMAERDPVKNTLLNPAPLAGQRYATISFQTELILSGSAGVAPRIGDLFEACGFSETVSAGSSVTYEPSSDVSAHKSVTIYLYKDGRLHKLTGARGSFKLTAAVGKVCVIDWSFSGLYTPPADASLPSSVSFEDTIPAVVLDASFTLNSVSSLHLQQIEIDMQNEVQKSDDINAASGIAALGIIARKPVCSINPEMVSVATYDFRSDWLGAVGRAMSFVIGSAAGNKATISCPKFHITDIAYGDREGRIIEEISAELKEDSGDDEISIVCE